MNNNHFYLSFDIFFNLFASAYYYYMLVLWNEYRVPSSPVLQHRLPPAQTSLTRKTGSSLDFTPGKRARFRLYTRNGYNMNHLSISTNLMFSDFRDFWFVRLTEHFTLEVRMENGCYHQSGNNIMYWGDFPQRLKGLFRGKKSL